MLALDFSVIYLQLERLFSLVLQLLRKLLLSPLLRQGPALSGFCLPVCLNMHSLLLLCISPWVAEQHHIAHSGCTSSQPRQGQTDLDLISRAKIPLPRPVRPPWRNVSIWEDFGGCWSPVGLTRSKLLARSGRFGRPAVVDVRVVVTASVCPFVRLVHTLYCECGECAVIAVGLVSYFN